MTLSEKRETLLRAFTELQNYAINRQKQIESLGVKSVSQYPQSSEEPQDFYTRSVALPKELYRMEVLFNLGRAFHQVGR